MGNMADTNDEARVGRVRTGSPQLVQGEFDARQSAVANFDNNDDNFEDVPDRSSKKKKKDKKDKKAKKHHGMGLYRGKQKKGNRESLVFENGDGGMVTEPREVKKAPVKVRYAPVVPSSEGMYRQVNAPKQRQRGGGRAAAAAVNPGNWFWMDVYWK
jgi:collagen type V/XI/XXIV/XXVII alpha